MKVAVIGAGASGLAAVKSCLEEGLEPTCYERCDSIGGLWHYSPKVVSGEPSVMQCTVSNVSKEMMCFSDFPVPKHYAPYMHHRQVDSYLGLYADRFGLRRYVKTNHDVLEVKEAADHHIRGRWTVKVMNRNTKATEVTTFDFVMVCSGIFGKHYIPDIPGLSTFEGRISHSHGYKDNKGFENKNVLVVGFGNSAGDVACDLTTVTKQVYISSRKGGLVLPRVSDRGLPFDLSLSRFTAWVMQHIPSLADRAVRKKLNNRYDHTLYGFCPQASGTQSPVMVNDDLPVRVLGGAIKVKPDIKCLTRNGVEFVDGSRCVVDDVVFATGYRVDLPFLSDEVVGSDMAGFYKGLFPTHCARNTLALIGCFRVKGPILPIVEMQSRVVVRAFTGRVPLPSCRTMVEEVAKRKLKDRRTKKEALDFILVVDFLPYLDELSEMINCKPNLGRMLFSDPKLYMKCIFGPACSYQYRLSGPHPWAGAREAVFTLTDRIYYPLNPDFSKLTQRRKSIPVFKLMVMITAVSVSMYYLFR